MSPTPNTVGASTLPADARLVAQINNALDELADTGSPLDQYVELTRFKRDLDQALKRVKEHLTNRQELLLEDFAEDGVTSKRHAATGKNVYVTRKIWARPTATKPEAAEALEAAGLGEFVERGFNTNSLSAYFREQAKQHQAEHGVPAELDQLLPDALNGAIALTDDHTLGVRA